MITNCVRTSPITHAIVFGIAVNALFCCVRALIGIDYNTRVYNIVVRDATLPVGAFSIARYESFGYSRIQSCFNLPDLNNVSVTGISEMDPASYTDSVARVFVSGPHHFDAAYNTLAAAQHAYDIPIEVAYDAAVHKADSGVVVEECGWPLIAVKGLVALASPMCDRDLVNDCDQAAFVYVREVSGALAIHRGRGDQRIIPLRPVWTGVVGNSLLFAAVLWLFMWAVRSLRSRLRKQRGECPACGHDLRGYSGTCPECGSSGTSHSVR
jgi:hypothetical protein